MSTAGDMAAFGASHHACYKWPEDTAEAKFCRAAFCEGAAWAADEIELLREACRTALIHAPSIRLAPERRHTIAVLEAALRTK
jgi:hypothetical protein